MVTAITAPPLSPNRLVRCPNGHPHRAYCAQCPVCEQGERHRHEASDRTGWSLSGRKDQRQMRGDRRNGDCIRAVRLGRGRTPELLAMGCRCRLLGRRSGQPRPRRRFGALLAAAWPRPAPRCNRTASAGGLQQHTAARPTSLGVSLDTSVDTSIPTYAMRPDSELAATVGPIAPTTRPPRLSGGAWAAPPAPAWRQVPVCKPPARALAVRAGAARASQGT